MKKGLTAVSLEIIAALALLCEHLACMTFGFYTPQAYVMQIIGKTMIPIICFLCVENYQKTTNLSRYMLSLLLLWALSIYPFHVLFKDVVMNKQNFIFDLIIGMTALVICDSKKVKGIWKPLLLSIILFASIHFSNSPLVSIWLMTSFHHKKSYKNIRKSIITISVTSVLFMLVFQDILLCAGAYIPERAWLEPFTYLGLILAIPFLKRYKREETSKIPHYFEVFYPLQLLLFKDFVRVTPGEFYQAYLYIHIFSIILAIVLAYKTLKSKLSRAQIANLIMILFTLFFMLGYYIELTAFSVRVMQAAVKIEVTGIAGMLIAFTWFINEFCDNPLNNVVYILEGIVTSILIYAVFTQDKNHLFYRSVGVRHYKVHSAIVENPGPMYIAFYVYIGIVIAMTIFMCWKKMRNSEGVERKQSATVIIALVCVAVILIFRGTQTNKEYDFITFALASFLVFFTVALCKNDYFGDVQTEQEQDPLTGLSNRSFFVERVQNKLAKGLKGTMFMIDMDNFKYINDNYGHGTGDKVLIAVADSLKQVICSGNYITRLGGDEFCAFICDKVKPEDVNIMTENIVSVFQQILKTRNLNLQSTLSIGVAVYNGKEEITFDELYENADKALYLAKNSGKSQCKFYA